MFTWFYAKIKQTITAAMQAIKTFRIIYRIAPEANIQKKVITEVPKPKAKRGRPRKELSLKDLEEIDPHCEGIDSTKLFIRDIGSPPLLTKEEEVSTAIEIENANKAVFEFSMNFGGFAEFYVNIAKDILSGDKRFDTYIGDYEMEAKEAYLKELPKHITKLEELILERRTTWRNMSEATNTQEKTMCELHLNKVLNNIKNVIKKLDFNEKIQNEFRQELEQTAKRIETIHNEVSNRIFTAADFLIKTEYTHCISHFQIIPLLKTYKKLVNEQAKKKEKMIKANMRLVFSIARKYANKGLPLQDIIQEGSIGLMKAVDKFEYKRGFKFSTYATWWVRQAITHAISDKGKIIRIPIHLTENLTRLAAAQKQLQQDLKKEPTVYELSTYLKIPVDKIKLLLNASKQPISMQTAVGDDDDAKLEDFIEDSSVENPMDSAANTNLSNNITELLEVLPDRDKKIIQYRFGLIDGEPRTLEEVGKLFNVTRERIRQIEAKALKKLRHPQYKSKLAGFIEE